MYIYIYGHTYMYVYIYIHVQKGYVDVYCGKAEQKSDLQRWWRVVKSGKDAFQPEAWPRLQMSQGFHWSHSPYYGY